MILRNRIIWHFEHGLHAKNRFSGRYEVLLWFSKSNDEIINIPNVKHNHLEKTIHPCQFPIEICFSIN